MSEHPAVNGMDGASVVPDYVSERFAFEVVIVCTSVSAERLPGDLGWARGNNSTVISIAEMAVSKGCYMAAAYLAGDDLLVAA